MIVPGSSEAHALRGALEKAWGQDTAYDGRKWLTSDVLSTGQCAVTALLAQDLFGWGLVSTYVDGQSHWFSQLSEDGDSVCVDITGDQFGAHPVRIGWDLWPDKHRVRRRDEADHETLGRLRRLKLRLLRNASLAGE